MQLLVNYEKEERTVQEAGKSGVKRGSDLLRHQLNIDAKEREWSSQRIKRGFLFFFFSPVTRDFQFYIHIKASIGK